MDNEEINFLQILKDKKPKIYKKILEYLPDGVPKEHYAMMRDYSDRQGKYFRPALVLLSNELFGGKEEDAILTAAGMQTSEDWILVHDDIQDGSEERRGKPCLHRIHGMELAINAADALHVVMWKMFKDNYNILDERRASKVFDIMYRNLMITTEGQYYDISWIVKEKVDITEEEYYKMVDRKTAAYTVYGPLQLGAAVAGASSEQIEQIKEWGTFFGRAFQIRDDVLNLIADEKYGKEIGGDILEGKRTLMLVHLLRNCKPDEKKKVIEIFLKERKNKTEEEKNYVLTLMRNYGSIDYAQKKAEEYAEEAKRIFDKSTSNLKDTFAKKAIRAGIDFVVKREK